MAVRPIQPTFLLSNERIFKPIQFDKNLSQPNLIRIRKGIGAGKSGHTLNNQSKLKNIERLQFHENVSVHRSAFGLRIDLYVGRSTPRAGRHFV